MVSVGAPADSPNIRMRVAATSRNGAHRMGEAVREGRTRRSAHVRAAFAFVAGALMLLMLSSWASVAAARPLGIAARAGGMHGSISGRAFSVGPARVAHAPRLGTRAARTANPRRSRHASPPRRASSAAARRPSLDEGPGPRPRPYPHDGGPLAIGADQALAAPHGPSGIVRVDRLDRRERDGARRAFTDSHAHPRQGGGPAQPLILPPPPGETRFAPDEVLIEIATGVAESTLDSMIRRRRLTRIEAHEFRLLGRRLFRLRIQDGRSVPIVLRSLGADRRVAFAQPNYVYALQQSAEPGASPQAESGAESGSGSAAGSPEPPQYAALKLRLGEAHALARGDNVLVAVIDSGIDDVHPDLQGVIADRFDTLGGEERAHPHGTAIAGAIASRGKLIGVAPRVRLLAIRAFDSSAPGAGGTTFQILKGLDWAHAKGARVINMSFSGPSDPALRHALAAARRNGLTLVAAAGNAGPKAPPLFPAADPNVIAVTATDSGDRVFAQASRGAHIAVAAPGVDILAPAPDKAYQISSGTSVAAAHVSGVAALILERSGGVRPDLVRRILTSTARRPRGNPVQNPDYGAGLADAYEALLLAERHSAAQTRRPAPPR